MKIKTWKLIATITATTLLGSALGVGTYAITKSNNDFGFKGMYDLNAFAATADTQTKTVMGKVIDTTTALRLTSDTNNDGTVDYTLFVSIVDTADMSALSNIEVGYSIGDKYYNGTTEGLSNVIYSSLTINTTDGGTATITPAGLMGTNTNYSSFNKDLSMFIIAEVAGEFEGAGIEINGFAPIAHNFTTDAMTSTFFTISSGNLATGKGTVTYNGLTLTKCLKMETKTSITFTLPKEATITLVVYGDNASVSGKGIKIDGTKETVASNGTVTKNLDAGTHTITKGDTMNLYYIDISVQHDEHTWSFNKVTDFPTAETPGTAEFICVEGGETDPREIPVLSSDNYDISLVSDDGHDKVTSYKIKETLGIELGIEGVEFNVIESIHSYAEVPSSVVWNWESDYLKATASITYKCNGCESTKVKSEVVNSVASDVMEGDVKTHTKYTVSLIINGVDYGESKEISVSAGQTEYYSVSNLTGVTDDTQYSTGSKIIDNEFVDVTASNTVKYDKSLKSSKPKIASADGTTQSEVSAGFKTALVDKDKDTSSFIFTASKNIELTVYYTIANDGYNSDRTGKINYYIDSGSVTTNTITSKRDTMQSVKVTLKAGQKLTIYATNTHSSTAGLWLFGYSAKTV